MAEHVFSRDNIEANDGDNDDDAIKSKTIMQLQQLMEIETTKARSGAGIASELRAGVNRKKPLNSFTNVVFCTFQALRYII